MTIEAAGTQLGWQLPPPEPETLASSWVHELDRQGVYATVLIASIPGDEGDPSSIWRHRQWDRSAGG